MAKRILMILGGMFHDFRGFSSVMKPVLIAAGHAVESTYDLDALLRLPQRPTDIVLSYTSLSRHREGQPNDTPETLSPAQTEALAEWVRAGGGLVAVHGATVSGKPNPAMRALLGGVFREHPPQFPFTVVPLAHQHPVTAGVEAFTVKDELYIQDYDPGLAIHMVTMDRGVAHPMVWTREEGGGRVAHLAPGHGPQTWEMPAFQRLVLQAVDWAGAGG